GNLTLTAEEAEARRDRGERVILARRETSPEDIRGMAAAEGLLTAWGGMTSHAALVSRQMGKVAVVGVGALELDVKAGTATFHTDPGPRVLREGEPLSLDGFAGEVLEGLLPTRSAEVLQALDGGPEAQVSAIAQSFKTLLGWADEARRLRVRANADLA